MGACGSLWQRRRSGTLTVDNTAGGVKRGEGGCEGASGRKTGASGREVVDLGYDFFNIDSCVTCLRIQYTPHIERRGLGVF